MPHFKCFTRSAKVAGVGKSHYHMLDFLGDANSVFPLISVPLVVNTTFNDWKFAQAYTKSVVFRAFCMLSKFAAISRRASLRNDTRPS